MNTQRTTRLVITIVNVFLILLIAGLMVIRVRIEREIHAGGGDDITTTALIRTPAKSEAPEPSSVPGAALTSPGGTGNAAEPLPTPGTPEPTPTPVPTPEPDPEYYTISFIGDCTLAENYDWRGRAQSYQSVVGDDYAYPFANTADYFRNDYLTLANLECILSDHSYTSIEWYHFLAPAAYVNILTEGCVDFVTLANNHTQDYGQQAYNDTLAALSAVNMPYAGENETYLFQRDDGLKVGIFCLYNDKVANVSDSETKLRAGLDKLKAEGAEFTIAALHWGVEGAYSVSDTQIEVGHFCIDAGYNVVYGSHPHRLEPVEHYKDGLIFYSMSNWSFGGHTNPSDYDTAIAQFTVEKIGDRVSVQSLTLVPCSISSSSEINNYQPTPYEEGGEEWNRTLTKLDGTFEGADYNPNYQSLIYGT